MRVTMLKEFLAGRGLMLGGGETPSAGDFAKVTEQAKGRPDTGLIHMMILRTMAQARYSAEPLGHFGLALEHYAHFTSPIRRYPDLTVHRSLEAWLELSDNGRSPPGGRRRRDAKASLEVDPRCPVEGALAEIGLEGAQYRTDIAARVVES